MTGLVLFVHDHKFKVDSVGSVYSEGKITNEVLDRYKELAPVVRVIARAVMVQSAVGLNKVTADFAQFSFVRGGSFGTIFGRFALVNFLLFLRSVKEARACVIRLPSALGLVCWLLCRLTKKPYFVEVVGDARESLKYALSGRRLIGRFVSEVMDSLTRRAVRGGDGAIYVTQSYLQGRYPTRGISAFASNVEVTPPEQNPYLLRAPTGPGRRFVVGTIGSFFNPSKGFAIAIKAVAALIESGADAELRILGDGHRDAYFALASELGIGDAVFFDGTLPGGEPVLSWLAKLDAYVQPSLGGEGLPRALIEAMSMGVPAVGTSISGLPELLSPQFVIPPGNAIELSRKLFAIYSDRDLQVGLSHWSFTVAASYSRERLVATRTKFWKDAGDIVICREE